MIIKPIGYGASEMVSNKSTGEVKGGIGGHSAQKVGERATLSIDTITVKSLTAKAMQQPEIRQVLVEGLKASIRQGSYSIDAGQTASAILADQT